MAAIAIAAVAWVFAIKPLLRPYPSIIIFNGGWGVAWSDGTTTMHEDPSTIPHGWRWVPRSSPILGLTWPDGSLSLHWRWTPQARRPVVPKATPDLGIPPVRHVTY